MHIFTSLLVGLAPLVVFTEMPADRQTLVAEEKIEERVEDKCGTLDEEYKGTDCLGAYEKIPTNCIGSPMTNCMPIYEEPSPVETFIDFLAECFGFILKIFK